MLAWSAAFPAVKPVSVLKASDQNGNPLAGGYLTEDNASVTLSLSTTQTGLSSATINLSTVSAGDAETGTLANPAAQGNSMVYSGASGLTMAVPVPADGKLQASAYDSLFVKWINPMDTSNVATLLVPIRPAPKQARAYFSAKADGSDTTDQYLGTETTLYLFIVDQLLPAGLPLTASVETAPKNGAGRVKDTETFNLTSVAPGKYRATLPVDITPTSVPGNGRLQLAIEDGIKGSYRDPIDQDAAIANAGFGISAEIDASLQFTDKNGNVLPNGVYYSPKEGVLYLAYKDDWVNGTVLVKTVTLSITNNLGRANGDVETFTLTLNPAKHAGSTGVWEGALPLKEGLSIKTADDTAEVYVLGEIHAVVTSHSKSGSALVQVSDDLLSASPNRDALLTVGTPQNADIPPNAADTAFRIELTDQSLSEARDTLSVSASCTESKDVLINLYVIESTNVSGHYFSGLILKSTGVAIVDGMLQCNARDVLKVSYKDPVYGDIKTFSVAFDEPIAVFSPGSPRKAHPKGRLHIATPDLIGFDARGRPSRPARP
jgi:hypothetical protein